MPELPEVDTIVQDLNAAGLVGLKILKMEVFWVKTIASPEPLLFSKAITGQTIKAVTRRGKYILFSLTGYTLLVHLRMTGKFSLSERGRKQNKSHERIRLNLEDGRSLHYLDQRKFGKWELVKNIKERLAKLGIEPLSEAFSLETFIALIAQVRMRVKPFLLDQQFVAGIGNIYADEALWWAKIHPQTHVYRLTSLEIEQLYKGILVALRAGLANKGTSLGSNRDNYFHLNERQGSNQSQLNVFRREDLSCQRCQSVIVKIVVAQRGTHFCPTCQVLKK